MFEYVKYEQNIKESWDNFRQPNLHVFGIPEG